jgi:hypothetical protein
VSVSIKVLLNVAILPHLTTHSTGRAMSRPFKNSDDSCVEFATGEAGRYAAALTVGGTMKPLRLIQSAFFIFICVVSINAQDSSMVIAEYDSQNRNRLIRLSNMTEALETSCALVRMSGTIVGVKYDEETGVEILGIGVRERKGSRSYINLDEDFFLRLPRVHHGYVPTILAKGNEVRIEAYACGASGGVLLLHDISSLRQTRKKNTPSRSAYSPDEGENKGRLQTWELIITTDKYSYYLNIRRSSRTASGTIMSWEKAVPRTDTKEGKEEQQRATLYANIAASKGLENVNTGGDIDWSKFESFSHSLELNEYDCTRRRIRTIRLLSYGVKGNLISESSAAELRKWRGIVPDSIGEKRLEYACRAVSQHKRFK